MLEYRIEPLHIAADILTKLGSGGILTRARRYSHHYDNSIFLWAKLRHRLILETLSQGAPVITSPSSSTEAKEPSFVPDYPREKILKNLTLPQLMKLAAYETPSNSEVERLIGERTSVTLPSVGMPMGLTSAATLVLFGICLTTFYFWLYFREAGASVNFPASATLFGVFARSRLSRWIFRLLNVAPPIPAVLLAYRSYWITPANAIVAALAVPVAIMISREEHRQNPTGRSGNGERRSSITSMLEITGEGTSGEGPGAPLPPVAL